MATMDEPGLGDVEPQYHAYFERHTTGPLADAEAYRRVVWHNKHLLFELKLSVIVVLGGIIVLACVVYIVLQCRSRARTTPSLKEDEKELFGSTDTFDTVMPLANSIRLKVRKDQEYFV